jgi:cell division protein FtsW
LIRQEPFYKNVDYLIILSVACLLTLGLVMVASSTIAIADRTFDDPFHYLKRQVVFVIVGLILATIVLRTPMDFWDKYAIPLFIFSLILMVVVLIPGLGRTVKGSTRWINMFGLFGFQPAELLKLMTIIYFSGYLVRHQQELKSNFFRLLKSFSVVVIIAALLMLQPDFGTTMVIFIICMGMMFLAGISLFYLISVGFIALIPILLLIYYSPYRLARIFAYLNPWDDPFGSGYQLTQALIAFGRGEYIGVGIGSGIQKLFYLPDAHTDFLFAVMGEELGVVGVVSVMLIFLLLLWRIAFVAWQCIKKEKLFEAFVAYGIGIWIGLQTFINMGVNMGLLPTKGITLPFMSAGGSSMLIMCLAFGLLMRIDYEQRIEGLPKQLETISHRNRNNLHLKT